MNHIWLNVKQLNKISSKTCPVLVMNTNHCLNMVTCDCFSSKYGDIYSFFSQKKPLYNFFFFGQHNFKIHQKLFLGRLARLLKMRMVRYPNGQQCYMWVANVENWTGSREQEGIFGAYLMANHQLFLEYFHAMWVQIMWCGIIFLDEVRNILPHG